MPRRRTGRFVLEALFLAGAAAAVTVAELRPTAVIALMTLAWVIVALAEWASWLDEPHYGRGLPPRFYVPQVALPPSRPVEQHRYPIILEPDDEPTFEESLTEWADALQEWPVLDASLADEETQIALPEGMDLESESPTRIALPPLPEAPDGLEPAAVEDELVESEPVDPEPEPAESAELDLASIALAGLVASPRVPRTAVHHVDPLASTARRRFLFRRGAEEHVVEVPDGPPEGRRLSGAVSSRAGARKR